MNDILLKAQDISFTYEGEEKPALNHLSLELKRGRKIACMGSNGSGKSTFFLCCNGILKPSSGTLFYDSAPYDYSKKGLRNLRSRVGIVFQDPDNQLFSASVAQEISFGLFNLGFSEDVVRKKVSDIMEQLNITPFAHKPVHALSGGQKKLVALADILVMEPELILLDEPASALDAVHTQLVRDVIDKVTQKGITVCMSTHDMDYAYEWADEVLLFRNGQMIETGTPGDIFRNEQLLNAAHLKPPLILSILEHPELLDFYQRKEYLK